MLCRALGWLGVGMALVGCLGTPGAPAASPGKSMQASVSMIQPPAQGALYHAVYPGGSSGAEDDLTPAGVDSYEAAVGKSAALIYFSNNWGTSRAFPASTASWIRDRGSVPFIRLMLRTSTTENVAEPTFTLDRVRAGDFDADLHAWGKAAHDFGSPLLIEYGTEMNGQWFSWNGIWNGAGGTLLKGEVPDGPQRFREAYRHIVSVMRLEKAANIRWVFHVNNADDPVTDWNRLERYYPGDDWVDWIGVSVYGAQKPTDAEAPAFRDLMDAVYPRLAALSPQKPIALLEFGVTNNNPLVNQADWASLALADLEAFRWPRVMAFAWWNETWPNDDNPAHNTDMRVQSNSALASVFKHLMGQRSAVLGKPIAAP